MKPSAFTQNDNAGLTPQELNGQDWEGGKSEKKRRGQEKLVQVCVCRGDHNFSLKRLAKSNQITLQFRVRRRICALKKQWLVNLG